MTTLSSLTIPTPKNWEDFENICLSSFVIRWNNPNLVKNGRQGQSQNGVDIYGEDNFKNHVGVQCKKYDYKLTVKTILAEIEKAEQFQPPITFFYFATTAPADAKIQKEIRIISARRSEEGQFSIGIFFWDDIIQQLLTNQQIFNIHFPQFDLKQTIIPERAAAIFDLAYRGLGFKINLDLILGEMSEDRRQILTMCTFVETIGRKIISSQEFELLINDLNIVRDIVNVWLDEKTVTVKDIHKVQNISEQIVQRICAVQYDLNEYDLTAFTLGQQIVNWDYLQTTLEKFELNQKPLLDLIQILFDDIPANITQLLKDYDDEQTILAANYPHKLFILCRRQFTLMKLKSSVKKITPQ